MTSTPPPTIADPTDPPAVTPADMAEFVAMLQNATARQLFTAEAIATVNIGAGADVEASAEYLDAIHAEQAHRAEQAPGGSG